MTGKIVSADTLCELVSAGRKGGAKVGFTNGCFDILHIGHVRYLAQARAECDLLVVGLNSDSSVRAIKGPRRPVNDERARAEVLAAMEAVDHVTLFDEETPASLIVKLSPDVLFKGGDWKEDEIAGARHVKDSGGRVRILPYVDGFSTTDLIRRIKEL